MNCMNIIQSFFWSVSVLNVITGQIKWHHIKWLAELKLINSVHSQRWRQRERKWFQSFSHSSIHITAEVSSLHFHSDSSLSERFYYIFNLIPSHSPQCTRAVFTAIKTTSLSPVCDAVLVSRWRPVMVSLLSARRTAHLSSLDKCLLSWSTMAWRFSSTRLAKSKI